LPGLNKEYLIKILIRFLEYYFLSQSAITIVWYVLVYTRVIDQLNQITSIRNVVDASLLETDIIV
jgi:hypothetical protein